MRPSLSLRMSQTYSPIAEKAHVSSPAIRMSGFHHASHETQTFGSSIEVR